MTEKLEQKARFAISPSSSQTSSTSRRLPLKSQPLPNTHRSTSNPFKLPRGGEWLSLRRNYSLELSQQRANERTQNHIYKKHTFKTRHTGDCLPRIRNLLRNYDAEACEEIKNNSSNVEQAFEIAKRKSSYRTKPIQREFVSDIIANKRQLFLAEYVLQTKREALTKLQISVQEAEKDLAKSEKKLETDATLFDEFLKATDKSAVEAMQQAENISATRLKLVESAKHLHLKKAMLQSELSRFDEMLFTYLRMKRFIWQIYRDNTDDDKAKKVIANIDSMITVDDNGNAIQDAETLVNKNVKDESTLQTIPFKTDSDIIEIISELEDNNLSMIHHFQHSEELLDDLKLTELGKKQKLQKQVNDLKMHVQMLDSKIESREKRAKELAFVCKMYEVGSYESEKQDQVLNDICQKIERVYKVVVGQLEIKIDGLMMLTSVENRLQDLIEDIESFPIEKVRLAQKFKDKQRRLKLREEKQQEQREKQKERTKRAQERAQAIAFRQKGRRLVFRSDPVKNGKVLTGESETRKNKRNVDDDSEFFTW